MQFLENNRKIYRISRIILFKTDKILMICWQYFQTSIFNDLVFRSKFGDKFTHDKLRIGNFIFYFEKIKNVNLPFYPKTLENRM